MNNLPPAFTSAIFNTSAFYTQQDYLTKEEADKLYLSVNLSDNFLALSGVIAGIASPSKALIVDSSRNINNINILTAEELIANNGFTLNGGHLSLSASSHIKVNSTSDYSFTTDASIYTKGGIWAEKSIGCVNLSLSGNIQLNQTQNITFYRNQTTLDINSYIKPETGNDSNLSLYSLRGSASIKMLINNTGTNTAFLINSTSTETPSATNLLTLYGNGNLGIGLNTPSYKLDVAGDINTNTILRINRTSNGRSFNSTNGTTSCILYHYYNGDMYFGTSTETGNLILMTNNGGRLTINSTGNITIANTSSGLQLNLGNTGTGINVPNLQYQGTTFNFSYYISMLTGGAEPNKAVVLNSDKDYSGIRNFAITGTSTANDVIVVNNISVKNIALNNTTDYRTVLDCGSSANDRILGLFNNGSVFYGFGANASMIRILSGGSNGTAFYSSSTMASLGNLDVAITSTALDIKTKLQINATDVIDNSRNLQNIVDINMSGKFYDSNNYEWLTGSTLLMRLATNGRLSIGTNTDSAGRDLSILNTNANAGFRIGAGNSNGNCCTIQYTYVGNNNNSNKYSIDFFGKSNQFCLLNSGNCGIGTGSPTVSLDVVGEVKATTNIRAGLNLVAGGTASNARLTVYSADENIARFYRGTSDYIEIWRNTASSYGNSWVFGSNNSNALYFETNGIVRSGIRASGETFVGNYNASDAGNAIFNVNASKTITLPSGYGYLNSAGNTGTISTPSAQNYSCYFKDRIWIANGEINITSDKRIKTNIQNIDLNDCYELLDNVEPKTFNYKSNPNDFKQYGFIAQDILKTKIGIDIVNLTPNEEMSEEIEEDGFVNPANYNFTLEREHIIAVQFKIIQDLNKRLIKLEKFLEEYDIIE